MELVDCPTGLVAVLSPFYCPHQATGIWMEEKRQLQEKSKESILGKEQRKNSR